jgi:hypothetical protein
MNAFMRDNYAYTLVRALCDLLASHKLLYYVNLREAEIKSAEFSEAIRLFIGNKTLIESRELNWHTFVRPCSKPKLNQIVIKQIYTSMKSMENSIDYLCELAEQLYQYNNTMAIELNPV